MGNSLGLGAANPANAAQLLKLFPKPPPGALGELGKGAGMGLGAAGAAGAGLLINTPKADTPNYPTYVPNTATDKPPYSGGQNPNVVWWLVTGQVTVRALHWSGATQETKHEFFAVPFGPVAGPLKVVAPWVGLIGGTQTIWAVVQVGGSSNYRIAEQSVVGSLHAQSNNEIVSYSASFVPDPTKNPPNTANPNPPSRDPWAESTNTGKPTLSIAIGGAFPPELDGLQGDKKVGGGLGLGLGAGTGVGTGLGNPALEGNPPLDLDFPDQLIIPSLNPIAPNVNPFTGLPLVGAPTSPTTKPTGNSEKKTPSSGAAGGSGQGTLSRNPTNTPKTEPKPEEKPKALDPVPIPDLDKKDRCNFVAPYPDYVKQTKDAISKNISGKIETTRAKELREDPSKPNQDEKKIFEYQDNAFDLLQKAIDAISKQLEEVRQDLGLIKSDIPVPESWNVKTPRDRPQLIIVFQPTLEEIKKNPEIRSLKYSLSIPHAKNTPNIKVPDYRKGNVIGILELNDNSKIYINAFDKATAIRMIRELLKLVDPSQVPKGNLEELVRIADRKTDKVKTINVRAVSASFYAKGREKSVTEGKIFPDKTYDLRKSTK